MLPSLAEVIAALPFLARRFGLPDATATTMHTIAVALEEARSLASEAGDEPAALFYALARRPRGLRGMWRTLTTTLTLRALASSGMTLGHSPGELDTLRVAVAMQTATYDDVRRWFAARV